MALSTHRDPQGPGVTLLPGNNRAWQLTCRSREPLPSGLAPGEDSGRDAGTRALTCRAWIRNSPLAIGKPSLTVAATVPEGQDTGLIHPPAMEQGAREARAGHRDHVRMAA